jgi:hypothetical protein
MIIGSGRGRQFRPRVVVLEFNAGCGPMAATMCYKPDYRLYFSVIGDGFTG